MISKVRKYLSDTIKSYDKDFTEHKDAFNSDNISKARFDKNYFITYSTSLSEQGQAWLTDTISVTVELAFKGYRCPQEALDNAMDTATEIKLECAKIENITNFRITDDVPLQSCTPTSQVAEPLGSNDNSFKITLEFDVTIILANC